MTRPGKSTQKTAGNEPRSAALEVGALPLGQRGSPRMDCLFTASHPRLDSWAKRTDTPLTPRKRSSSKPPPIIIIIKKNCKQQHPNYSQSDSLHKLNRPEQIILFRLKTDLMPTCTISSRLMSLRCAHATQTS